MNETQEQDVERVMATIMKLKPKERVFMLRSQDITAAAFTMLWCDCHQWLTQKVANGMPLEVAVDAMQVRFASLFTDMEGGEGMTDKNLSARNIAVAMATFPERKLAD